jgi:hypothetical protein
MVGSKYYRKYSYKSDTKGIFNYRRVAVNVIMEVEIRTLL